jgi:signal transduction histidine kinase
MSLKDDGIGINNQIKEAGNGLKNMEERARIIGGKAKWKSSPVDGTSIIFIGKINGMNKTTYYIRRFFNAVN